MDDGSFTAGARNADGSYPSSGPHKETEAQRRAGRDGVNPGRAIGGVPRATSTMYTSLYNTARADPAFEELYTHPQILSGAEELLGSPH